MANEENSNGRRVKCEGRFSSVRNFLYEDAIPLVLDGATNVDVESLREVWDLVYPEILGDENFRDPYFENSLDRLRVSPPNSHLALIPLLESPLSPNLDAITRYSRAMGCSDKLAGNLSLMTLHTDGFLAKHFSKDTRDIHLPDGKDLRGYRISVNTGIGTISQGGTQGGGIRSDSPFIIEVYQDSKDHRGETGLVGVVGFWPQNERMLVSQMQSCRNARFPEGVKFGVACLSVAETFANCMGFEGIDVYSARNNPQFLSHPDSWGQLEGDFKCMWDSSAHKLGYVGSNTQNFAKDLPKNKK